MKKLPINLLLIFCTISCNFTYEKNYAEKENTIISKIKYKKNKTEIDTLWVSQNDTTVFKKEEVMITRPCSSPKLTVQYKLIKPRNEVYYFIYDENKQLIMEGKHTNKYTYEGQTYKIGNFYNSKSYRYKTNGNLKSIHNMNDGRNDKIEFFDRKKRVTEITYFDKKTSDKEKVEIYNKGKLKETKIYTNFDSYYILKTNN